MNKENYAKAKIECLERLKRTLNQDKGITEVFDYTFDRAYALGKQEKDSEEEEMLAISRREIQQLVAVNDKLIKKHPGRDSIEAIQAKTVNAILHRLFGSKCLLDEEPLFSKSPENYNNENLIGGSENKAAEPKGHIT